jgi:hypothetical protein
MKICLFYKNEFSGNHIRIPAEWDANYEDRWLFGRKQIKDTNLFYVLQNNENKIDKIKLVFEFVVYYKQGDKIIEMTCGYC